jgi:hypothetical protein
MTLIKRSLTLLAIPVLLATSAAFAKDGDGRVERSGSCSGSSNWEITAKPDSGRLEVEFDVDQNRNGVRWHVVLKLNGEKVREGNRKTQPPSGSFSFDKRLPNPAGEDKIVAIATRASGERCRGVVRI